MIDRNRKTRFIVSILMYLIVVFRSTSPKALARVLWDSTARQRRRVNRRPLFSEGQKVSGTGAESPSFPNERLIALRDAVFVGLEALHAHVEVVLIA